jgi:ATP-binding protein involved in chromosome partitioning
VGILDADLFGPSIPKMMNLQGQQPQVNQQNLILPLVNYGIKCMSMGFLVDPDQALVWRGLMVMQGIQKLLRGVKYGPLNYLLIDMPPGTGDTQLSLTQNIPISGAVVVTTPQAISLIDARKGITMFKKVNVNILGLMENMSYVQCEKCNHKNAIYGTSDGLSLLAADTETQVLARIPYDRKIMQSNEDGKPFLLQHPDSDVAQMYATTAKLLISRLGKPLDQ